MWDDLGVLGLDSWVWSPGFGALALDFWILTPGQNHRENLIKTISFSTKFANHGVPPPPKAEPRAGEPGPETHFFLQALISWRARC